MESRKTRGNAARHGERSRKGSKALQARVDFGDDVGAAVRRPVTTCLRHDGRNLPLGDEVGPLHGVDVQARGHVPRDVAVEGPDARVVGVVLDDEMTGSGRGTGLQDLDIPSLRVRGMDGGAVPRAGSFVHDPEVVSVEVHGVGGGEEVANDELNGRVLAEVVDVPLRVVGIRGVAEIGEQQKGVTGDMSASGKAAAAEGSWGCDRRRDMGRSLVVGTERRAVHVPQEISRSIRFEFNVDGLDGSRLGWRCDGKIRNGRDQRILATQSARGQACWKGTYIAAERVVVRGGRRVRFRVGVGVLIVDCGQSIAVVAERAGGADVGSHPHGIGRFAGCFN